jgi:hypothetical protein
VSVASRCEICSAREPHWTVLRRGDVAVTWACDEHLAVACGNLQRDFEVTELVVTDYPRACERAGPSRIAGDAGDEAA